MGDKATDKNTSATTNVTYSGAVKVSLCRGSKVVKVIKNHNAGTPWLFKVLASALCGNDERKNMPRYLDAGSLSGTTFTPVLAARSAITGKHIEPTTAAAGYSVYYTAFIPYSSLLADTGINALQLHSSYSGTETLLAQVELSEAVVITSASYNLMVEWVVAINNVE